MADQKPPAAPAAHSAKKRPGSTITSTPHGEAFTEAATAEAKAYAAAQTGDQMARAEHFRALAAFVKAEDACRAFSAKKEGSPS